MPEIHQTLETFTSALEHGDYLYAEPTGTWKTECLLIRLVR